jgi:hypothetical protein
MLWCDNKHNTHDNTELPQRTRTPAVVYVIVSKDNQHTHISQATDKLTIITQNNNYRPEHENVQLIQNNLGDQIELVEEGKQPIKMITNEVGALNDGNCHGETRKSHNHLLMHHHKQKNKHKGWGTNIKSLPTTHDIL